VTSSQVIDNGTASVIVVAPLAAIVATLAASNGLTYTPVSVFNGIDTMSVSANDTLGHSATSSVSITVAGPLSVMPPDGAETVKVNGTLAVSGFSLDDRSLPNADEVTVVFTASHGTVSLSTGVTGGISAGQVVSNGTDSVAVTAPLAAIDATLAATSGLTYTPAGGFNGSDVLTLAASDTLGNASVGSVVITVAGPIAILAPGQQTVSMNSTLVVSGLAIADPWLPTGDNVTVVFTAIHGTVTLSTAVTNGITGAQVTTNGTASVSVAATLAEINSTLADASGVTYAPTSGFNGMDTVSISASDTLGNSSTASVSITVTALPAEHRTLVSDCWPWLVTCSEEAHSSANKTSASGHN
jgi:hypothetical protein